MITGIILASGFSKRMKRDKLLLKIEGMKIVEKVVQACKESVLDEIILIYRKNEVKEIGEKYNIRTIYNPHAYLGQSAGLKLGVINAKNSEAYMFIMGDQPYLKSELIDKLIFEYKRRESTILVPCYNGKNGTPTVFSSIYENELLKVKGDKGGREIIKDNPSEVKRVHINDTKMGLDIDTLDDFKSIVGYGIKK